MRLLLKLAVAGLRGSKMRLMLTSLATIAAATMVVWVGASYDALLKSFKDYSADALGHYQLSVAGISTFSQYAPGDIPEAAMRYVPETVVGQLRADPAVAAADPMWARRVEFTPPPPRETPGDAKRPPPQGARRFGRTASIRVVATDAAQPPFPMAEGRWIKPQAAEVAITVGQAKRYGIQLGDTLKVGPPTAQVPLKVVGVVAAPAIKGGFTGMVASGQLMTPGVGGLYIGFTHAERVMQRPRKISFIAVRIAEDTDITAFRFRWATILNALSTPCQFQEDHDLEETLDQSESATNVRFQAYTSTAISLLAALFIIFSALSMGVTERTRQLAILRAIVLTRTQVALLVALEALVLGAIGFLGGLAAGQGTLSIATTLNPALLGAGAGLGGFAIGLAAICAFGGALLAAIPPMIRATRVSPLEAMVPVTVNRSKAPWRVILIGAVLLPINLLITFTMSAGDDTRVRLALLVGFPAMVIGTVLIAPAVIALVDRLFSPLLARLVGVEPRLLASQLSSNLWRAVGTASALTVGLSLFVAVQVWGHTMLSSFIPGPWAPDALVWFKPAGMEPDRIAALKHIDGIDAKRVLPLVAEQPRLRTDLTGSADRASVTRQDSVVLVGLDPQAAFGGARPLFEFEWLRGSRDDAVARMANGRACIVPEHFLRETGLKIGDGFELVPPGKAPSAAVRYTIAGSVRLHGWHWQTKLTGFRSRTHRAAALVFTDYAAVAQDFEKPRPTHAWLAYDRPDIDPAAIEAEVTALFGSEKAAQADGSAARFVPIQDIRKAVDHHARQWLWAMSMLPLITLLITGLGVLNLILASVRARRWAMGVMRAIGVTRGQLIRLVIAEGVLVGVVAVVLSCGLGILAGYCGAGISQYISFFGGWHPPLVIPWSDFWIGLVAALVLAAVAAIGPAISVGRAEPLTLLQRGRAST